MNTVMGCQRVSSRLITIRLMVTPFNIIVVRAYAPTTDYDNEKTEDFYEQHLSSGRRMESQSWEECVQEVEECM